MKLIQSIVVVLCLATLASAQPLADRVPADSIVYVGWRGTNDPGGSFAGSHTEAILKDSSISKLVTETIPALVQIAERQAPPEAAEAARTVGALVKSGLKYPTAFYLSPPKDGSSPRAGVLIQAGGDKDALLAQIQKLIKSNEKQGQPQAMVARAISAGDAVVVLFGYGPDESPLPADAGAALGADAAFKLAVSNNEKDPTYLTYISTEKLLLLLEQQLKGPGPDAATAAKFFRLADELGLRGVQSFSMSGGFTGKNWRTSSFVAAKGPRKGLLAIMEGKPFSADLLKRVPASANLVSASRFDPNKFISEIRRAANAVDPDWGNAVDQVTGAATAAIGKNLETGVLGPLGDEWISYSSIEINGTGVLGTVLLNKPDDALKAKQGLASLAIMATNTATSVGAGTGTGVGLKVKTIQSGEVSVSYMSTAIIAPAWALKDGILYMGLYPQSVIAAVNYAGPGIDQDPKFKEAIAHLEQTNPIAFKYTDTARTIDDGYNTYQAMLRTFVGVADAFGGNVPEPLLPPLSTLQKHALPVGQVVWSDEAGIHMRSNGPFPGADALARGSLLAMYTSTAPVSLAILLPSIERAREQANRIKSAANLRTIGQAAFMYSNEDVKTGKFPDDFEDLLRTQDITPDIFVNPRTSTELPPIPPGKTAAEALGEWVNTQSDYVYVGKGKTNAAGAEDILAYEKPDGLSDGINILYCDGHVDFVSFTNLAEVFKAAKLPVPALHPDQQGHGPAEGHTGPHPEH